MAGDQNAQINENFCVQLQNLSVKLLRCYVAALLYLPMKSRVNEDNTTVQHVSNKLL